MTWVISIVWALLNLGQAAPPASDGDLIPLDPPKPAAPVAPKSTTGPGHGADSGKTASDSKPPTEAGSTSSNPPMASAPAKSPPTATPAPQGYADPGDWLVDLARHHGHLLGRTDARKASLRVLALLEAAKSVSPGNAEASFWSFDILSRIGRTEAALIALRDYVRLNPSDDAARLRLTELELLGRQSAPERADYIQTQLKTGGLTRIAESDLRGRLGEYYYERRENDLASTEIERALRLNPLNINARQLGYELFGETEPALQRIELALQMISANPAQINLVWDLAAFLDQLSLHKEAQEFYNRAIAVHQAGKQGPVPAAFQCKLAMSYISSGDHAAAREAATTAIKQDDKSTSARLIRAHALRQLGDTAAADVDLDAVNQIYQDRIAAVTAEKKYDEAAEIAWFYCYHRPDKAKALEMAKVAMSAPTPSSLARLANGWAMNADGHADQAVIQLEPLAEVDQFAALELGRIYVARDQKSRAATLLAKAASLQYSGIAYDAIAAELKTLGEKAPALPSRTKLTEAIARFDRRVFDFVQRPGEFLSFSIRFVDDELPATGPIRIVLRAENIGPFPITFGEGYMSRPLVAISAKIGDKDPVSFDNYLQVMLNARPVLVPRDAIEKTVAIDIGPIRDYLAATASRTLPIEVRALFDPIYQDEHLVAGPGTLTPTPITARRIGLDVSPTAVSAINSQSKSTQVAERIAAADRIGAILANAVGQFGPLPAGVDLSGLRGAMATLLADADWQVKAHALVATCAAPLDDKLTAAAAPSIRDPKMAVRMLAVRLFAERQGAKFGKVLDTLATGDTDRAVRMLARSYLSDSQTAASPRDGDATP